MARADHNTLLHSGLVRVSASRTEWLAAANVTVVMLIGLAVLSSLLQVSILAVGLIAITVGLLRSIRPVASMIRLSLTFVIPVLLIHGVLNPQFPVTTKILDFIPLRQDGFTFGSHVATRVIVIFVLGALWLSIDRDKFVNDLISLRVPLPVVLLCSQAVAVASTMQRRAHAIYDAQQARGIKVGPGVFTRISALPKVMLPLFVAVISDAYARADILATRGFGSGPISVWHPLKFRPSTWLASGIAAAIVALAATVAP